MSPALVNALRPQSRRLRAEPTHPDHGGKTVPAAFLPLRKLQSHGVVMGNEALDKSSCILLGKGAAWPERIEFEAAVPSLDFTVALRVIREVLTWVSPARR